MRTQNFLNQLCHDEIVAAIREAELRTSGELRVFISRKEANDAVAAAQVEFTLLGMTKTAERNGVLIFVAPRAQTFAVIGDTGIHAKCGHAFWQELADAMSAHFRNSDFTQGLLEVIRIAGDLLAEHFPRGSDYRNELSVDVLRD